MGLVRCTILAPRGLFYPVLPDKIHKKWFFALSAPVSSSSALKKCEHSDKER
jgi:hypothetical protein